MITPHSGRLILSVLCFCLLLNVASSLSSLSATAAACPKISPATGLENRFYTWKDQKIRFQSSGGPGKPVLLIHGLFVNSDHWRKSVAALEKAGYNAFALDLFGCGYSDKPAAAESQSCNGEAVRFNNESVNPSVLKDVTLGTAGGRDSRVVDVDLRHPLGSPYNFYTWADLISDFSEDIVLATSDHDSVSLVCNSIGTISSLQAVMDTPQYFSGVFVVCPNFRELHSAEIPFATLSMPVIRAVQRLLREKGQGAFDYLTKPSIIRNILMEPYAVTSAIDDTLVDVLLNPLLTEGSSQVVFDTLSYSAGPLPEQQLQTFPKDKPVWVCYGDEDPWTPGPRVESLANLPPVEKVTKLNGVGHCPHDEAPELVNPLMFEFLKRLEQSD